MNDKKRRFIIKLTAIILAALMGIGTVISLLSSFIH